MAKVKDSVRREIVVQASLERVWEALTKPEHLNRWYTKEAEIDFRIGGKGYMNHGWGATSEGVYKEIDAMKRFVLESPDGDFRTITELVEVEDGIKVSIEYRATFISEMDEAAKENMLFGTGQFLENLKSVYETGHDNRNNLWRTWIGVSHTTNQGGSGTKILRVKEGSTAAKAGVRIGDIITDIDDEKVLGYEYFERLINSKSINQTVMLHVVRGSEELDLACEVDTYPVPY
ncbi:SRPBCC family protein [Ornithinibacillus californiensis]|uniref:SRPBCC family protein n=1 Tax=Ornithinibacillus californiensis TaxID=161536 RepID=UPI00069D902B|nr:SRPBCC domain-containing protein [Ornithinibacillus californiensis]